MEKMIVLSLISYVIVALFGEAIWDATYDKTEPTIITDTLLGEIPPVVRTNRKWLLYLGLFVLLKQMPRLHEEVLLQIVQAISMAFVRLIKGPVPTFV